MSSPPMPDPLHRNNVTVTGNADGRTMMFAHGFGCSQVVWDQVAPHFESDYNVILFDHVGAGGSDATAYDPGKYDSLDGYADDVLEILRALDAREVVFVGHSVSAMIGVIAANRDPSLFSDLVLIGPSPCYINDDGYYGGFERADIAALLDTLDANYVGWSRATAPMIIGNSDRSQLGARLTESFCSMDPEIARHFAHVTFLSDNRSDLRHVSVPTLVMQSGSDAIAPVEVGQYVHSAIPASRLAMLQTTGHVPILAGPDEVVATMRAYLA